jgi:lipopolysaccharide transport system permease protein
MTSEAAWTQPQPDAALAQRFEQRIRPESGWFDVDFKEIPRYRALIWLLVRRDFVSLYKQTLLGPAWFILKPLLTTLTFVLIFGRVAKLSTDGLPHLLFYFSGTFTWLYFSDVFTKVSGSFIANANLFRKVYFPRLIIPISILVSGMATWLLQLLTFGVFIAYYRWTGSDVRPNSVALLTPALLLMLAAAALGLGILVAALTMKYRDLSFLLSFGIQLMMYATPVIYPVSAIPEEYRWLFYLNPLTPIMEAFRYGFLGSGTFSWPQLAASAAAIALILLLGLSFFGRAEKTFVDLV